MIFNRYTLKSILYPVQYTTEYHKIHSILQTIKGLDIILYLTLHIKCHGLCITMILYEISNA